MSENAVIFVSQLSLSRKGGEVQATDLQNCGRGVWKRGIGLAQDDSVHMGERLAHAHGRLHRVRFVR
jgi:hypothetical protein